MPIGPTLPPHLAHLQAGPSTSRSPSPPSHTLAQNGQPESDDEEDDFGPALPPHLAAARRAKLAQPTVTSTPPLDAPTGASSSRITLDSPSPPRITSKLPNSNSGPLGSSSQVRYGAGVDEEESDDDDVIGPVLPTSQVKEKTAAEEFMEREERMKRSQEDQNKPKQPQREEWMLVPPTSGILASAVDPLRKRPTTFSRNTQEVEIDSTVWTETPLEKAQRLADEVAGIKRKKPSTSGQGGGHESGRKRMRDEEIRASVDRHNKEMRGKSLLDQHASKDKKKEEAPAIWDHGRDMGITGRLLNDQERGEKIRDAKNLNDRFGHSKRGAYDM